MHCPWLAFLVRFNGARFRGTGITEYLNGTTVSVRFDAHGLHHLAHFSISSAMSLPKSAGEPGSGVLPKLASREFIFGSAKAALTSLLSLLTISVGVFLGAPRPHTALAS